MVEHLVQFGIRRFRPRIGWPQTLLALAAALCPAIAANESALNLPASLFLWAGLLGLAIGLRAAPPRTKNHPEGTRQRTNSQEPRTKPALSGGEGNQEPRAGNPEPGTKSDRSRFTFHISRFTFRVLRLTLWLIVIGIGIGSIFVVAAGRALPPLGLMIQDGVAWVNWLVAIIQRTDAIAPANRTWAFLSESLPRFWGELRTSPSGGERGARLIVAVGGVALTWAGALMLGRALGLGRTVLGWGLPLLVALALTTVLGAGSGTTLCVGFALLLLLAITAGFSQRTAVWDRAGVDFSGELHRDILLWGVSIVIVTLLVALVLPAWIGNPVAEGLWRDVEVPSGLAVLEQNIQRAQRPRPIEVGLSALPALELGYSLAQDPPEQIALRARLDVPLPTSAWPHYWRARLFNVYNGRGWTTDARVRPFTQIKPVAGAFPGAILQEIEDARPDRPLMIALPDAVAVDAPTRGEYLSDSTLAALTWQQPTRRYQVLSRPQELAEPPLPDRPEPDMGTFMALPGTVTPRVRELARAFTRDAITTYEQALALERELRALPYEYQVQPVPGNGDAVDQFLFDMRQGYCTYYASAMAVLARSLGIPARVATGYYTGEYDPASNTYIVREADAHAWPELYVNGLWVPFEPTPIRPLPARSSGTAIPTPIAEQPPAEELSPINGPLIWVTVLAGLALLWVAGIWWSRRKLAPLVTQVQLRLERYGARAGVPWPAGATLHEYGALLEPHMDGDGGALDEVVELVELARYGGRTLEESQQLRLRAASERVWARLRHRSRR